MLHEPEVNYTTGYIKIFRSLKKHWIWSDSKKLQWWLDIILTVNHKAQKVNIFGQLIDCGRGQSVKSLESWARDWGTNKATVRRFLKLLEKDSMLVIENLSKTTRITVCNYGSYNDVRNADETQMKRKRNADETQMYPNNKVKNDKVLYTPSGNKQFDEFIEWVNRNAPRVNKMQQPITLEEFIKLTATYTAVQIGDMFVKMHNNKPLIKNNVSTYLTFLNWISRETK